MVVVVSAIVFVGLMEGDGRFGVGMGERELQEVHEQKGMFYKQDAGLYPAIYVARDCIPRFM
jgi:hypothetical protein